MGGLLAKSGRVSARLVDRRVLHDHLPRPRLFPLRDAFRASASIDRSVREEDGFWITPPVNTLDSSSFRYPADLRVVERIRRVTDYNATALVYAAVTQVKDIGGHLSTPLSTNTILTEGLLHFFDRNDHVWIQGHALPWVHAFDFQTGRRKAQDLLRYRHPDGPQAYPHWVIDPSGPENSSVSMGQGPLSGIYQAGVLKFLETTYKIPNNRHVWVMVGDGETREPESLGALLEAKRYRAGNLTFIVNLNLQSLDGLVRPTGSIAKELESVFRGNGWDVIKVLWGKKMAPYLKDPLVVEWLNHLDDATLCNTVILGVEGNPEKKIPSIREELVRYSQAVIAAKPGLSPALQAALADQGLPPAFAVLSQRELKDVMEDRGGHECERVHQAMAHAKKSQDRPTVILTYSIKGYGNERLKGRYGNHSNKGTREDVLALAAEIGHPVSAEAIEGLKPELFAPLASLDVEASEYVVSQHQAGLARARRKFRLPIPAEKIAPADRVITWTPEPALPDLASLRQLNRGNQPISSTMALNNLFAELLRTELGKWLVFIGADELRTAGLQPLIKSLGVWTPDSPVYFNAEAPTNPYQYYREAQNGRVFPVGISEEGGACAFTALGRAWQTHGLPIIPIFWYYSMFLQRMADFWWKAGDEGARGIFVGGVHGKTQLPGEGTGHNDGHSTLFADEIPPMSTYHFYSWDAIAITLHHALSRIVGKSPEDTERRRNALFYLLVDNEKRLQQATVPDEHVDWVARGGYPLRHYAAIDAAQYASSAMRGKRANLFAVGHTAATALKAQERLRSEFGVMANVFEVTSPYELNRDWKDRDRADFLHPDSARQNLQDSSLAQLLRTGQERLPPAEQNIPLVGLVDGSPKILDCLGTPISRLSDGKTHLATVAARGWGSSGPRDELRSLFEIDERYVMARTLHELGMLTPEILRQSLQIDPEKPNPALAWPPGLSRR